MKPEYRKRLEETVIATPIEYLLLETDGPYVKPERPDDVTGKKWAKARNTSLILPNIAEKIAELKGMMVKDVGNCSQVISREVFCHEYGKIPRHTGQNAITEGDLECILTKLL